MVGAEIPNLDPHWTDLIPMFIAGLKGWIDPLSFRWFGRMD